MAEKAIQGIAARKEAIQQLLDTGIRIRKPEPRPLATGPLAGKTFCFTGAIKEIDESKGKPYKRKHMEDLVKQRGGQPLSNVTGKLDYLVMADPSSKSSKAVKARKLGTKILSEKEFFAMVE